MPSKEKWELLKRRAKVLRSARISYEDIAAELSSDEVKLPPWTIYSWCNPAKTGAQITTWREKHFPQTKVDPDDPALEYLRRLERADPDNWR